jgi:17 kDa outer membrane surface antigen
LRSAFELSGYKGSATARLRRVAFGSLSAAAQALLLALMMGGCSFSYQLDTAFKDKDSDVTGSIRSAMPKPLTELPPEADLAYARAAVSEIMVKGGNGASMPWENPHSGARGTITPIATAYEDNGATCHEFLASYIRSTSEAWLQGEACRSAGGRWEVRSLKPWQRT